MLPDKNLLLTSMGATSFDADELVEEAIGWGKRLREHLDDTTWLVQTALARGEHVLLEGAQGTLLDLDHGSYPFVTSSNPVAGGACTGGGIGPLQVDEVIGVMKAYSTRVGSGPYPTELHDDIGKGIAERGHEFGTVTGRPRRVGWFDAVPLRYAVAVNSVSSIMVNKLDILSGIDPLRVCVAYELDGRRVESWPSSGAALARSTPVYDEYPGWDEPINAVRSLADLPENARRYLSAIEGHAGVPIVLVSVGPERTQTIERAWRPMRNRAGITGMSTTSLLMPTRVLIVGGGGREHALAWKLGAEPGVNEVIVAPGSEAIAREPRVRCVGVDPLDPAAVVGLARQVSAELVVIGPEAPLAAGVADALREAGIVVFGPSQAAARIESSKAFCHEVADAAGVRMARAATFTSVEPALTFARELASAGDGVVVKADGLAAGKGVTVCDDVREAARALEAALTRRGARVVVEERLVGREASLIALADGRDVLALPLARDHKRLLDGDAGPNTGGMGAYSPLEDLSDDQIPALLETFHRPILAELARRGTPFRGALYAGLMLTEAGPVLLECNARFGDPETQVLLPRLAVALGPLLLAAARGELAGAARALGIADCAPPGVPGSHGRDRAGERRISGRTASRWSDLRSRRRRGRRCDRPARRHRHRPGWHRRHRRRTGSRGRRSRPGSRGGPGAGRGGRRRHHVRRRPAAARHRSRLPRSLPRCPGRPGDPSLHARRDGRHLVRDRPIRGDAPRRARGRPGAGGPWTRPRGRTDARWRRDRGWTSIVSRRSRRPPTTTSSPSSARSPRRSGPRVATCTSV